MLIFLLKYSLKEIYIFHEHCYEQHLSLHEICCHPKNLLDLKQQDRMMKPPGLGFWWSYPPF